MRNPQKGPPLVGSSMADEIKKAAWEKQFDRAAVNFYFRHNGEPPELSLREFLSRFERAIVFETLVRMHGSQKGAADLLKVKKQTLNWKVRKQHIQITKQITKQPQ